MKLQYILSSTVLLFTTVNAAPGSLPVCIVGAGPAGLVAASKLEAKGYKTVVFEQQSKVGGKCQAVYERDGTYHPLGALLFSNQTYTETLKIINPSGVKSVPFNPGALWLYDYMTGASVQQAAPSAAFVTLLISELQRYALLWQTFAPYSGVGYKKGVPAELAVTTAEWLATNNFQALPVLFVKGMFPFGYGDLRETPILYMLQYFTPDVLGYFAGLHEVYLIDFHKVFVRFAKTCVKGPILLSTTITQIDRSGPRPIIHYRQPTDRDKSYEHNDETQTQTCSKLILAFPPTLSALSSLRFKPSLTPSSPETTLFGNLALTPYFSSAVSLPALPHDLLLEAASSNFNPTIPPPAAAEPVAFLHLFANSNVATAWSWGAASVADAYQKLKVVLSKLDKDPSDPSAVSKPVTDKEVLAFVKHDYFPHFGTADLKSGAYGKFNDLQGKKGTYYASGLNGVETVEFAIRAGVDVVANYF